MKFSINLCGVSVRCDGNDVHEPRPARHLEQPYRSYQLPPHPRQGAKDFHSGIQQWIKSSTNPEVHEQVPRPPKLRVGTSLPGWARRGENKSTAGKLAKNRQVSPTEGANLPRPEGLAEKEHRALAGQFMTNAKENGSEELDLENLGLKVLPEQVDALVTVESMNLNYNQLGSLPSTLVRMVNLLTLSAGLNQIKRLPVGMDALRKLTHLDVSGNLLEAVPPEIGDLSHLQTLYLDWNRLTSLPKELGRLESLEVFNAGTNLLTSVPAEMGNLRELRRVDLSLNKGIYSLPSAWNELIAGLVKLDLSGTSFSGFHDTLPFPLNMTVLNLCGTDTRTLPRSFGTLALEKPPHLDRLRTTNRGTNQITVLAGECNLATQLAGEARMVNMQKSQIPKHAPQRHALKRAPYQYENHLDGEDSDDGEDIRNLLEFGMTAAPQLEHVRRAREVATGTRPLPGPVGNWAAKQAADAALTRGDVAPNQIHRPWNDDAPAVPWAQPGTGQGWGAAGWAGRGRPGPPQAHYPWERQPMGPQGGYGAPPMAPQGGYGAPPIRPLANYVQQPLGPQGPMGFQGNRAPLQPMQQPLGFQQHGSFANPAGTPFQRQPPVPSFAYHPRGATERPAWAPQPTWTDTLGLTRASTRASEALASVNNVVKGVLDGWVE
jgi:hypothetical protein